VDDPRFSVRHGIAPQTPEIAIREDAPRELRGMVVDFAYECDLGPHDMRSIVCKVFMRRPDDDNWSPFPNVDWEVRKLLDECDWYEVYDIVEAIAKDLESKERDPLVNLR
jgi:AbiJ N-terminal domain 4